MKRVLSDHAWAKRKWSLNRGGLLIEVTSESLKKTNVSAQFTKSNHDNYAEVRS